MADKYPMDITIVCSIALEGALKRYRDVLPKYSDECFNLVHEWNIALQQTLRQPEYKSNLGTVGKIGAYINPVFASVVLDKVAVPYRSYYYARRFLGSASFVRCRLSDKESANVVDFGRGLSPWGHYVKMNCPNISMYSFDMDITNKLFADVSNKLNLEVPKMNQNPKSINFDRDFFVSLGTFVYMTPEEQVKKLEYANRNFKNLYIELDKEGVVQDDKGVVNKLGADYSSCWNKNKIAAIMSPNIPYYFHTLGSLTVEQDLLKKYGYTKVLKSLHNSTEIFLVR